MRRLCPSTSLKPDPGLRLSSSSSIAVVYVPSVLSVSLFLIPRLARLLSVRRRVGLSLYRARSFDYCFVKCDVKDSKITLPSAWPPLYRLLRPLSWFPLLSPSLSISRYNPSLSPFVCSSSNPGYLPISPLFWTPSSRRGKCSLRKFKFIPGSRSLEERIKGPGIEPSGSTRRYLILSVTRLRAADMLRFVTDANRFPRELRFFVFVARFRGNLRSWS